MKKLTQIKAMLEFKLADLATRAEGIEGELNTPGDPDWDDNAIESEGDEVLSSIGHATRQNMQEIKLALSRIESGDYEKCSSCGSEIARGRLTALPFTSTCIKCA